MEVDSIDVISHNKESVNKVDTNNLIVSLPDTDELSADENAVLELETSVMKTGFMHKLARKSQNNWKERLFTLSGDKFTYYENFVKFRENSPKGNFTLDENSNVREIISDEKHCIRISGKEGSLIITHPELEERQAWLWAIHTTILYLIRLSTGSKISGSDSSDPKRIELYKNLKLELSSLEMMSGYVRKPGRNIKSNWKNRFLLLSGKSLTYFDSENSQEKDKLDILLTHDQKIDTGTYNDAKCCIVLKDRNDTPLLYFDVQNEENQKVWIEAFQTVLRMLAILNNYSASYEDLNWIITQIEFKRRNVSSSFIRQVYADILNTNASQVSVSRNAKHLNVLGVNKARLSQYVVLRKLGISVEEYELVEHVMKLAATSSVPDKLEQITGYTDSQRRRIKALEKLGLTEEELQIEISKKVGSIGLSKK